MLNTFNKKPRGEKSEAAFVIPKNMISNFHDVHRKSNDLNFLNSGRI